MFWSKNKKTVYPCKPQFYYIKVGCKGVFVTRTCFRDGLYQYLVMAYHSFIVPILVKCENNFLDLWSSTIALAMWSIYVHGNLFTSWNGCFPESDMPGSLLY